MEIVVTQTLSAFQKSEVFKLWNKEYPSKITYQNEKEFEEYLNSLYDAKHYIIVEDDVMCGWAFTFLRDQKKWFAVIIDSQFQSKGLGTKILNKLKEDFIELNGWVIDHNNDSKLDSTLYKSPISFYLKNDFQIFENCRLENEKISAVKIHWKKEN